MRSIMEIYNNWIKGKIEPFPPQIEANAGIQVIMASEYETYEPL